jgi:hypothetical protein
MDVHPRLFASVAAFTALAGRPAVWSRYTIESAFNSVGRKFAHRGADSRLRPVALIGAISAVASPRGVTCTDTRTGHFFRVSRES